MPPLLFTSAQSDVPALVFERCGFREATPYISACCRFLTAFKNVLGNARPAGYKCLLRIPLYVQIFNRKTYKYN